MDPVSNKSSNLSSSFGGQEAESSNLSSPFGGQGADIAIIGGGLAGLSLSILLARSGYKVVLFEKEKYPFHKVCGEYISNESRGFIKNLGIDLDTMDLPEIKKLIVSGPSGKMIKSKLEPGGFGISRYLLDNELCLLATKNGVKVFEESKVNEIFFDGIFRVSTSETVVHAKIVAAAFGKRSNLDIKWSRNFIKQKPNRLNNYIGVKYHVVTDHPPDTIALHNFEGGYCGISKIESNKYCLCYLTTAENLRLSNNSIKEMEKNILQKNPLLKKIFTGSGFLFDHPVTISQISFDKKSQVEDHVLMIGDAAGMITPLCGNGMSMALHSANICFQCIDLFLKNRISREEMEERYIDEWKKYFSNRLKNGRHLQKLFGKRWLTNLFINILKPFPPLVRKLISLTHGKPF